MVHIKFKGIQITMTNKHREKSLMQILLKWRMKEKIKITLRLHFNLVRMDIIKKTSESRCWLEGREREMRIHTM